jgi:class 3 adenylate cyclase
MESPGFPGRFITAQGGVVTAYDGDRIMAVYLGGSKNTSAAKTGLKINWVVREIINPGIKAQYPNTDFAVRQTVGIDTSKLWVTRTGVRGANDLVWVGRSANYAAKLTELDPAYPTRITADVFNHMSDEAKTGSNGKAMWERVAWSDMGSIAIYRSTWQWSI